MGNSASRKITPEQRAKMKAGVHRQKLCFCCEKPVKGRGNGIVYDCFCLIRPYCSWCYHCADHCTCEGKQ